MYKHIQQEVVVQQLLVQPPILVLTLGPPEVGDNLNNPIDLGDFNPLFSSKPITGTHGGITRRQSTFYKFTLFKPRSIQVVQNFSTTAYTRQTNRKYL